MKKIVLFGGTFDPFHQGHYDIIKLIKKQMQPDEIWILLTNKNPQKDHSITDYDLRYRMISETLKCQKNIRIMCFEDIVNSTYTYDTVHFLRENYKDVDFTFAIGEDQANNLATWYKIDKLRTMITFAVYHRVGSTKKHDMKVLPGYITNISSTSIKAYPLKYISKQTRKIIIDKNLYLKKRVQNSLSSYRFIHTCNVAELAKELAYLHHLDANKAYVAGLLHDITKEMTITQQFKLIKNKKRIQIDTIKKAILHQYSARYFIKNHLKIRDTMILQAVSNHTTLSVNCNLFDMVLYLADKLSDDRQFENKAYFLDLAKKDILDCTYQLYKYYYEKRLAKNEVIDTHTKNVLKRLEKEK